MQLFRTERFKKDFERLPAEIQDRVAKALDLFVANPRYPSLHVKKMEGATDCAPSSVFSEIVRIGGGLERVESSCQANAHSHNRPP